MAENKKVYTIQINGVKESIDAVDSLNKTLNTLDTKIKELESKTVTVSSKGGSSSVLSEEVALQREINNLKNEGTKLDAKIAATQSEVYQKVQATKDLYKEAVNDQKQLAAQERLTADAYSNTMAGMKQHLADLKAVINTTDLGDSDSIKKMTQEANELTNKLKEMEEAYGQFGRNVGNYANGVSEGLQKVKINVGGTVREFSSAREASRTLNNELKAMAINGDTTSDEFKQLREAVMQMESAMNDAKKPMDDLMDAMESFTAVASVSNGFAAFFGVDDSEIQKSIQRLLGLQTALKGIQTINKQIETREGFGKWIAPFTTSIDTATKKALVFNRALLGTGKAAKVAAVSINVFSKALKLAFSAGVLIAIELIIDTVMNLVDAFKKEGEEAEEASKKVQEAVSKQRETYTQASAQYMSVASRLSHLRTEYAKTNDVMKKTSIIKQAAEEFKKVGINVKNINDAQRLFVNNGSEVIEMIKLQGDAAAIAALRMEAFMKSYRMLIENGYGASGAAALAGNSGNVQELDKLLDNVQTKISEHQKKLGIATDRGNAKEKKSVEDAQKELNRIKIELMKEGLNKQITQLEEERKSKIAKIKADGIMVGELTKATNELYDKKIEKAKKTHAEKVKEIYENMWESIFQMTLTNEKRIGEILENSAELSTNKLENAKNKLYNQGISSYGIQGKNQYSNSTKLSLGITSEFKFDSPKINEMVEDYKKLIDIQREYSTAENVFKAKTLEAQNAVGEKEKKRYEEEAKWFKEQYELKKKAYEDFENFLGEKYASETDKLNGQLVKNKLLEENYTKNLKDLFTQRLSAIEVYWKARIANEKMDAEALYNQDIEIENKEYDARLRAEKRKAEDLQKQLEKSHEEDGLLSDKEYSDAVERIWKEHADAVENLAKLHEQNLEIIEQKKVTKLKDINAEYYQETLQEFRDFQTALNNLENKQPVMNAFGIVNLKKTNANNRELLSSYETLAVELAEKRRKLNQDFQSGLIDENVYKSSLRELDSFAADLGEKMDKVKYELSFGGQWEQLAEGIDKWVQAVGQAANQILSSLSEITSNQYQAQIDEQQKYIEKYEELLEKQKEATQKYTDEVNSIEDELKTARGDRRQQLIDNLNAQIAAERASLAQEKRIEKEREKAEERKKKLEHDQAVAKKKMDLAQAYINAAMAVSMAAVNHWPIPAIPMMSLAAAAGAAQIAAVASQNIPSYGDGGVIQGKSHAQGGVKVLGGRAEVEGGEFITNKVTTEKNVELLDFVNSKRKKLNLSDFIEFYGGGSVKKNINNVKTKFADGGIIPTLRSDITFNDRLLQSFEDYSNRPVTVSVVEINDKQAAVRNVQVLSGLEN